jgi:hypothetical protein
LPWALKLATLESIKTTFYHLHDRGKSYRAIDMARNSKRPPIRNIRALVIEEPSRSSEKPQISR